MNKPIHTTMKKLITSVLVALLPLIASADVFWYQGIYYNVTAGDKVEVTYPDDDDELYSGAIVIPERVAWGGHYYTVIGIGESAFYDCVNVTSVVIPNTVTYIDNEAFSFCLNMASVNIPNAVTRIGDDAFWGCKGLSSIVIPSSVTEIGDFPFGECYFISENFVNNSSFSEDDFGAVILGEGTVEQSDGLVISDNEVVLCRPWATSVTIPNSVTSIVTSAFEDCGSLTSVTIPKSVTSIGSFVFEDCSSLASMKVESGNPVYDSRNNCNAIIETATNTLLYGCMNTFVPSSVTSIREYAFWGHTGLTTITIPNSVTSIGHHAFFNCSGLSSVNIPESLTEIGSSTFSGCSSLTSVTIPNSVTSIGGNAFQDCGLTSIIIPESVTSINRRAFEGCSNLTSVTLPNSLTYIGFDVFGGCDNLSYNEYDNGLYLGNRENPYLVMVTTNSKSITSCTIREGCKFVADAFRGCKSLTGVSMPESVTFIGEDAFSYCSSLRSLTLGDGVTFIDNRAFYGCENLTSLTIPSSITRINGENVFSNCPNLQYAETDNGMYLGNSRNTYLVLVKTTSTDITDFEVSGWCKIISGRALYQCSSLKSVSIPESVVSIEEKAFEYCSNLTSVTLPSSVAYVGTYAFAGCTGISDFTCLAEEVPETERTAFDWSGVENKTLYVPITSIESYQSTYPWSRFGSIVAYYPSEFVKEVDGLWYRFYTNWRSATVISSQGYVGYSGDIVIPSTIEEGGMTFTVTEIDSYAFSTIGASVGYSSGITSITIPESVDYIGEGAFAGCGIPNILVKDMTPPYLGYMAFSDPTYYHGTLYIPNGSWYEYAFNSDWYRFINIRETTLEEEQLSMQQAYTLMDAGTFAYTVYDAVNNRISTVSVINEENPNHCWQVIEEAGNRYLYNLGAKKFAVASANGTLALTDEPTAIEMGDGEDGIVFGSQADHQWAFVSNDRMSVEDTIIDGIKSLTPTLSEGEGEWFDLSGRKLDTPQKGINIIRHADGTSKKVLVK